MTTAAVLASLPLAVWTQAQAPGQPAPGATAAQAPSDVAPVRRVVDAYIGLYTRERLPDWKALFLPTFTGFDFTSGGNTRRGQLMLLLIESKGEFKIAALIFSYHLS